jgi:hypothetical protein
MCDNKFGFITVAGLFEKIIKTVLAGLKLTNHLIDHACISLRSALTLSSASAIFLFVSIKDHSKIGPNTEPCGTPACTGRRSDMHHLELPVDVYH